MMRGTSIVLFLSAILAGQAAAQEGHPMTGSWVGDWGTSTQDRHRVVVIIEWTDARLHATINPGPDAIQANVATANPEDWSLHLEATGRDSRGRAVNYVVDGTIDDLGTYNRTLAGTWNVDGNPGDFSITRQ